MKLVWARMNPGPQTWLLSGVYFAMLCYYEERDAAIPSENLKENKRYERV